MNTQDFLDKLKFILSPDDVERIASIKGSGNYMVLTINLHYLSRSQAKRLLYTIIAVNRYAFSLHVIHGFNHGTALKEMLRYQFNNSRVVGMSSPAKNPGITYIQIAEQL